ncbi:MAG: hypothetical protein II872_06480, partial [Clostridia bacterium]|nr:hypothetical protein [Clostridia bacterium]
MKRYAVVNAYTYRYIFTLFYHGTAGLSTGFFCEIVNNSRVPVGFSETARAENPRLCPVRTQKRRGVPAAFFIRSLFRPSADPLERQQSAA